MIILEQVKLSLTDSMIICHYFVKFNEIKKKLQKILFLQIFQIKDFLYFKFKKNICTEI